MTEDERRMKLDALVIQHRVRVRRDFQEFWDNVFHDLATQGNDPPAGGLAALLQEKPR